MEYRIKKILAERDMSVSELANEVGMKRESLSRIVNGASTSSDTLQRIANVLDIHITELFVKPFDDMSTEIKCPNCGANLEFKVKRRTEVC